MATNSKIGGNSKKKGRSKIRCLAYRNSNRREHNKARRLKKHIMRQPNDLCGRAALKRCFLVIRPERAV